MIDRYMFGKVTTGHILVYSGQCTPVNVCTPQQFKLTSVIKNDIASAYQLMQGNPFSIPILHSPSVAAYGSHLHLVLVHRLQLVILIALPHGAPHTRIMLPQLSRPSEVVQGIERHAQQLVRLPQPIPGPVVSWAQLYSPPVGLCNTHTFLAITQLAISRSRVTVLESASVCNKLFLGLSPAAHCRPLRHTRMLDCQHFEDRRVYTASGSSLYQVL